MRQRLLLQHFLMQTTRRAISAQPHQGIVFSLMFHHSWLLLQFQKFTGNSDKIPKLLLETILANPILSFRLRETLVDQLINQALAGEGGILQIGFRGESGLLVPIST